MLLNNIHEILGSSYSNFLKSLSLFTKQVDNSLVKTNFPQCVWSGMTQCKPTTGPNGGKHLTLYDVSTSK